MRRLSIQGYAPCKQEGQKQWYGLKGLSWRAGGTAVTAKQARLKKESEEKCDNDNSAHCYDHTRNIGVGPIKVGKAQQPIGMHIVPNACVALCMER